MIGFIYKTTNLINGKIYIGQRFYTKNKKEDAVYIGSGSLFGDSKRKYGEHNFSRLILIECNSIEDLDAYEELFIELYSACDKTIGYNILPTSANGFKGVNPMHIPEIVAKISGENSPMRRPEVAAKCSATKKGKCLGEDNPNYGNKWSKEQRKNLSDKMKSKVTEESRKRSADVNRGRVMSEEARKKIGEANRNRIWSEGSREKISKLKKDKIPTEETRQKISDNHGFSKKVEAYDPETGEIFHKFNSLRQAHIFCKKDVKRSMKSGGKAGGFYWRYSEPIIEHHS